MAAVLPDLLRESAARFAERAALAAGGATESYAALDARAHRIAGALQARGLAGARVGLLLPNDVGFPAALFGLLRAGARAVMLNPQYSPREVAEAMADAGASTVLTTAPLLPLLPPGTRALLLDELPLDRAPEAAPAPLAPDDEAVVVFTAAQRGRARGARLAHRNLVANARATVEAMRLEPADRVLAVLPFVHLFGLTVTLVAPLAAGACVLPVARFHPLRLLELLEAEQATVLCGVPGVYGALLAAAERRGTPRHALRVAICGGAPLPLELGRRWEEVFGLPLREGYGLTEAGPVCLFNRVDRPNRPGTLCYAFPGVEVSIRDEAGRPLPDGEVGEICVRGENVFLGYLGEPGRTARDFHGEWLRTGDLGSRESDGAIRFRGLIKPMFTRNGFNVYPREIQRVLEADPRIARAEVYALPDAAKENEIVLAVTPVPGAALGEDDVRALCQQTLAVYKQPGRVEIRPAEPRP